MAEKGYCVKCKAKRDMKDEQKVTMKNKRLAVKGKCTQRGALCRRKREKSWG